MFKIIDKIGGRKVFTFLLSAGFLTGGYFVINDTGSYKIFAGSIVALATTFNAGNIFEHKYNDKEEFKQ